MAFPFIILSFSSYIFPRYEMRQDEMETYAKWDSQIEAASVEDDVDLLGVGDVVRVIQEGPLFMAEAIVIDPYWNGLCKVLLEKENSTNRNSAVRNIATFLGHEVELVKAAPPLPGVEKKAKKVSKPAKNGWFSRFVTVYLGIAVAYRVDPFNWIDIMCTLSCWLTQGILLLDELHVYNSEKIPNVTSLYVLTVSLFCLKLLGFLRGTGIKV